MPVTPLDCETLRYEAADGTEITFASHFPFRGRHMPSVELYHDIIGTQPGERFRGVRHASRLVAVPVIGPGPITERETLRNWARTLDPARGAGRLRVVQGNWAGRYLDCVYQEGLDTFDEQSANRITPTLLFVAFNPYWQAADEQAISFRVDETVRHWFPIFPLVLGASAVEGGYTIWNQAAVPVWPLITVRGPGSQLDIRNTTTGDRFSLSGGLSAEETLQADTRPGYKTVRIVDPAGSTNALSRLAPASRLWPLYPGRNDVHVGLGAVTARSLVTITWREQYLGA